jgi:hypothetical protein
VAFSAHLLQRDPVTPSAYDPTKPLISHLQILCRMRCPFALHVRQGMSNTSFPGNNLTEATSEASEQLGFNLLHTSASSESSALGILCNQLVREIP